MVGSRGRRLLDFQHPLRALVEASAACMGRNDTALLCKYPNQGHYPGSCWLQPYPHEVGLLPSLWRMCLEGKEIDCCTWPSTFVAPLTPPGSILKVRGSGGWLGDKAQGFLSPGDDKQACGVWGPYWLLGKAWLWPWGGSRWQNKIPSGPWTSSKGRLGPVAWV